MSRRQATRHAASRLQTSPAGFGTAHHHQPKSASISGASPPRRSRDPPGLGGWGALKQDGLLDLQPGCIEAEQTLGSQEAGGEASQALGGGLFPACTALWAKGCSVPCLSLPDPGAESEQGREGSVVPHQGSPADHPRCHRATCWIQSLRSYTPPSPAGPTAKTGVHHTRFSVRDLPAPSSLLPCP